MTCVSLTPCTAKQRSSSSPRQTSTGCVSTWRRWFKGRPERSRQEALLRLDAGQSVTSELAAAAIGEAVRWYQHELALRLGDYLEPDQHSTASATDTAVAAAMGGEHAKSNKYFELAHSLTEPEERSPLWLRRIGAVFDYDDDPTAAQSLALRAANEVSGGDAQVLQARMLRVRMFVEPLQAIFDELVALINAPSLDDRAAATVYLDAATCGWNLLWIDNALGFIERALAIEPMNATDRSRARQAHVCLVLWRCGVHEASRLAEEFAAEARELPGSEPLLLARAARMLIDARAGDAPAVVRTAEEMTADAADATHRRHEGMLSAEYAWVLSAIPDRHEQARSYLAQIEAAPPAAQVVGEALAVLTRARLARQAGDDEAAERHLQRAIDCARWRNARDYELVALRERAHTIGSSAEDLAAYDSIAAIAGPGLAHILRTEAHGLPQQQRLQPRRHRRRG